MSSPTRLIGTKVELRVEAVSSIEDKLTITLKDINGNPLKGEYVDYFASLEEVTWFGLTIGPTDDSGTIIHTVIRYNVYQIVYYGSSQYWFSYTEYAYFLYPPNYGGDYTPTKQVLKAEPISDAEVRLAATLTDINGNPLSGMRIEFAGTNDRMMWDYFGYALTDDAGTAVLTAPKYNIYQSLFKSSGTRKWSFAEFPPPKIGTKIKVKAKQII